MTKSTTRYITLVIKYPHDVEYQEASKHLTEVLLEHTAVEYVVTNPGPTEMSEEEMSK